MTGVLAIGEKNWLLTCVGVGFWVVSIWSSVGRGARVNGTLAMDYLALQVAYPKYYGAVLCLCLASNRQAAPHLHYTMPHRKDSSSRCFHLLAAVILPDFRYLSAMIPISFPMRHHLTCLPTNHYGAYLNLSPGILKTNFLIPIFNCLITVKINPNPDVLDACNLGMFSLSIIPVGDQEAWGQWTLLKNTLQRVRCKTIPLLSFAQHARHAFHPGTETFEHFPRKPNVRAMIPRNRSYA